MSELVKLDSGGELTTTGDARMLISTLAQQLHSSAVKNATDVVCDFSTDDMGGRVRLRFRSYRRPPNEA